MVLDNNENSNGVDSILGVPGKAKTNIVIPKEQFYRVGSVSSTQRQLFIDEVEKITLIAVVASRTMNIASGTYDELDVIQLKLKGREVNKNVLQVIDSVIPRPVLFCIVRPNGEIKYAISYKEPKQKDSSLSKVVHYYETSWNSMPITIKGNSIKAIYVDFIKQIDPSFDKTKPIAEAVHDTKDTARIVAQIDKINSQIKAELSLAKKQELARERYLLEQKLTNT